MRIFEVGTLHAPNWEAGPVLIDRGESIVETRGYMTLQQQIERALAAGVLYEEWRKAHFPPDFDIPDGYEPDGYEPDEMDIMAQYQLVVDGRTRTMAAIEVAQRKAEREAEEAKAPISDPRIEDADPVA